MSGFNGTTAEHSAVLFPHNSQLDCREFVNAANAACALPSKLWWRFEYYILEVYGLANIKSAKKRILVTQTRTARNKSIRSAVKTSIKKVDAAIAAKDKEAAQKALNAAISTIGKATSKGVYHKNTAGRKISRLTQAVNKLA